MLDTYAGLESGCCCWLLVAVFFRFDGPPLVGVEKEYDEEKGGYDVLDDSPL